MQRTAQMLLLAVTLLGACTRPPKQTTSPDTHDSPPPTFIEAEPNKDDIDSGSLNRLSIPVTEGLLIELHASPVALGGGTWGFSLELDFQNRLTNGGVFDLGPDPIVIFSVAVTLPDGSGFGSGGGCVFGTNLHGSKDQALAPGQRRDALERWEAGVEAGQLLEVDIRLCDVQLPDGRSLSGEIAELVMSIDMHGKLASFELRAVAVPQPRP
jgi:hypothetical protein